MSLQSDWSSPPETVSLSGTLPETNSEFTPENTWLEYHFPYGIALFSGAMLVLVSVVSTISLTWMGLSMDGNDFEAFFSKVMM